MEIINSESVSLQPDRYEPTAFTKEEKKFNLLYQQYETPPPSSFDILRDLHADLNNKNWEVRQQTLLKLLDWIPNQDIDMHSALAKKSFRSVTINLGHIVSSVRRLALETILAFVKYSKDPETVIKDMINNGIDSATVDTNLSLNTIQVLPTVLKYIKHHSNISHQLLGHVVTSLSKKMIQITHQRQVISSLLRIEKLLGKVMFGHFLETYYPQIKRDFDVLCNVYDDDDYFDASDVSETEAASFIIPVDATNDLNSGKEVMVDDFNDVSSGHEVIMKVYDEDGNEIKRTSSRRVTFGGEIVKIRTPDSDATVVANNTNEDLDLTADTLVQISGDESALANNESIYNDNTKCEITKVKKCSQIPLPIRPALSKPSHPRLKFQPFTQPAREVLNGYKTKDNQDFLMEIPNYEGESLTSSSDSSDRTRSRVLKNLVYDQKKMISLQHNVIQDLNKMKINDKVVLENLFKKGDWRYYVCAVEKLSQILRQPFCIQNISSSSESNNGVSLLCYIFNILSETKNHKVINSSLRVLRFICQAMQSSTLASYLSTIVPSFCSYLNPNQEHNARLESVEILKMLMRKFSPQKIVEILFSEQCFYSSSSKMRENSLLCLMYALITFPSTEFDVNEITESLIERGASEPKRRVRQALLDTLSILGQLMPKSKFQVVGTNEESLFFKKALRARLTRRQLPTVSQTGLILYAFQISLNTAFGTDIEWIMAGRGSLPRNCSKSKAQFNYTPPVDTTEKWSSRGTKDSPIEFEIRTYSPRPKNNFMLRGGSEEALYKRMHGDNLGRYSADWTDSRSTSAIFECLNSKYTSNLSDSSSYESSNISDQNFPKLQPGYEPSSYFLERPVSEDKLHRLPWSRNISRLPLKLKPTSYQLSEFYDYNTSGSLPVLNMMKEKSFKSLYQASKTNKYRSEENRCKCINGRDLENAKSEIHYENETEKIKSESFSCRHSASQNQDEDKTINRSNDVTIPQKSEENKSDKQALRFNGKEDFNYSIDNKYQNNNLESREKTKKLLERKAGVKLKRSLTKDIKIPRCTFNLNPNDVAPFEYPKDALQKILLQFESNKWETVIEALQGVIRLSKHHAKQLTLCLHPYAIAVAKEIRNLRSQVARAACLSAESIFKHIHKISDQDIEELSHSLFLRTADTNKFLREDSNKALEAMIDNIKFSKSIVILTQKVSICPNALIRTSTARLLYSLLQANGSLRILSLNKEKKELVINTIVKFLMDGNSETRTQGKRIIQFLMKDERTTLMLSEIIPRSVLVSINKSLARS